MAGAATTKATIAQHEVDHDSLAELAARTLSAVPRPFLRWAGSKQRLLRQLVPLLPSSYGRYFEPFLGAGSLFFLAAAEVGGPFGHVRGADRDVQGCRSRCRSRSVGSCMRSTRLDRQQYYRVRELAVETTPFGVQLSSSI